MHSFSPLALECLNKAGWHDGRKMPLVQYLKYRACLPNEGYPWFPAVADFLEEFGGLAIGFSRREYIETMKPDACNASDSFDNWWIMQNYTQRIGQVKICPIGTVYGDHLLLFIDDAGNVYGGFDDFLCFIGSNGVDAIEALCSNRPTPEIPEI
ncbi:MAG: SUKH-3 domain-containing protein [Janthinobacterium lividum]